MDTRTGQIFENVSDEEAIKKRLTWLTPVEYEAVKYYSDDRRPLELAFLRFVEERRRLQAPHGLEIKNAFRQGYLAAKADMNRSHQ